MKKIITTLLISAFITPLSMAASCDGIPEGTTVRIDVGSGALANAHIQDQDGLGTCYANQASTLLQSVIPGNPNLSYLNLALYYAKDYSDLNDQNNYLKTVTNSQGQTEQVNLVDGGFGCGAINSALKRQKESGAGVLCKTENTSLEHNFFNERQNGYIDRENRQKMVLTEASKYYGTYLKTFGVNSNSSRNVKKRQEADMFASALKSFVSKEMQEFGKNKCGHTNPKKIEEILSSAITRTLGSYPHCIKNNKLVKTIAECKLFDDLGLITNFHSASGKRIGYLMSHDVRKKFNSNLSAFMNMSTDPQDFQNKLVDFMSDNISNQVTNIQKITFRANLSRNFQTADRHELAKEYKRVVSGNIEECLSAQFLDFFKDKSQFLASAKADAFLCNYSELMGNAHALASALPAGTIKNLSDFVDLLVLKDSNLNYDETLMDVIANDCRASDRIKIPSSVSCSSTGVDISPKVANDSQKFNDVIKSNRNSLLSGINSGLPIGIDLCTRYWNDPHFDFNKISVTEKVSKCQETGKHGIHAVTMVGYRCKNNKVQYLAQNSWGPHWKLKDPSFEIEKGKIWLDEDKLFMNILRYNKISR